MGWKNSRHIRTEPLPHAGVAPQESTVAIARRKGAAVPGKVPAKPAVPGTEAALHSQAAKTAVPVGVTAVLVGVPAVPDGVPAKPAGEEPKAAVPSTEAALPSVPAKTTPASWLNQPTRPGYGQMAWGQNGPTPPAPWPGQISGVKL